LFPNSIIKKEGKLLGKTIAVFAGIHGNEKVGVLTLEKVVREIEIKSGTVYFVFANPPAIEKNAREINKNLNRLFSRESGGEEYEDKRATELMDLLDKCEALLDIHSYNSPSGDQFAISEPSGFGILNKMDFPIVASGFSSLGHGTDGYMENSRKIGICIECGTSNNYMNFLDLAEKSVYQFLQHFECIENKVLPSKVEQRFFRVKRMIYKETNNFKFTQEFKDFDLLPTDKPFAIDGEKVYTASENEAIIFPRPNVSIGGEVCIIGEFYNI
jgi:succinylglutamate desuccinylase